MKARIVIRSMIGIKEKNKSIKVFTLYIDGTFGVSVNISESKFNEIRDSFELKLSNSGNETTDEYEFKYYD